MARLQILELPEGTDDSRPPFVLVVDQCMPQRVALGVDTPWCDYWQEIADRIGARGVIVTPETVEIPANDAFEFRADSASAQPLVSMERAEPFTSAPLSEIIQDAWDGHRFGVPGFLDPQRCAVCRIDRQSWEFRKDTRSCATVRADAESGHDFRPLDPGGLACLRCGMPRVKWAASLHPQDCDAAKGGK